ncbi:MAG: TonB-dependent receptor [Acidobacteria bacterium]|nr:TonB-dependent receptor [Acidobacteriota bacterium]
MVILAETFFGSAINFHALAQSGGATTGEVTGLVIDVQGGGVAGVNVMAQRIETGLIRQTQTDASGQFRLLQLPPGLYRLTVEAAGFHKQTSEVTISIGTSETVDFQLVIEGAQEVMEITASDDEFRKNQVRRKTESSTIINQLLVNNLPINQRDFLDFSRTSARVTEDRIPSQGVSSTSKLSFNGQASRFNNINVDGLDNNDAGVGAGRSTFSQESVREFQIISDSFSAEFGRSLGGIINIVTRGGSNAVHGTLFGFFRNEALSARNAFSEIDPPFKQAQFGAIVGGPIKRDKAFFFTSFERRSIRQSNIVTITDETIASIQRQGFQVRNGPIPFSVGNSAVLGRLDINLTPSTTFWMRFNDTFNYDGNFEPFGGLTAETSAGLQRLRDTSGALGAIYVNARLNLVNETRFLISHRTQQVQPPSSGGQVNLVASGGNVIFGQSTLVPGDRDVNIFQLSDTVALVHGTHQIKFGGDFLHAPGVASITSVQKGLASFLPLSFSVPGRPAPITFTALEAFDPTLRSTEQRAFLRFLATVLPQQFPQFPANTPLDRLGLPMGFQQGFGQPRTDVGEVTYASAFAQDEWTVRPNLLLKAGLRFDLEAASILPTTKRTWSPRFALSYNPTQVPRLNIRASYGMFFAVTPFSSLVFSNLTTTNRLKLIGIPFPFSILAFGSPGNGLPVADDPPSDFPVFPQFQFKLVVDPNLKQSYTQQAVLELNWLVARKWTVSATYSLVQGRRLVAVRDINPVVRPVPGNPLQGVLVGRVDPTRGPTPQLESGFGSSYHGMTLALSRHPSETVGFSAHYTFSKAIDNFLDPIRGDLATAHNSLQPALERGLSVQDVRHRFIASGQWKPNFFRHPLLRDYRIATIIRLESGRPYNLLAGIDVNMNGDFPPADRPLVNGVPLGRNVGITPGLATVDLRLTRTLKLKETVSLELIAEGFNLLNHTNINQINNVFPPDVQGNFNLPTQQGSRYSAPPDRWRSAFAARQFQLGFRLSF